MNRREYGEHVWKDQQKKRDAQDRRWAEDRDTCHCRVPIEGPTYFKVTPCLRCGRTIR